MIDYRLYKNTSRKNDIDSLNFCPKVFRLQKAPFKVSKGAKIRNRYSQVPHLTQDTNGKVTNSQ